MLKLKLQYFGYLMRRIDSLENTLMLEKIERRRRRGWQRMRGWMASLTQQTWVWASSRSWWWAGKPDVLLSLGLQRVRYNWVTELNWIEWPIHFIAQQKLTQHCKATISQFFKKSIDSQSEKYHEWWEGSKACFTHSYSIHYKTSLLFVVVL